MNEIFPKRKVEETVRVKTFFSKGRFLGKGLNLLWLHTNICLQVNRRVEEMKREEKGEKKKKKKWGNGVRKEMGRIEWKFKNRWGPQLFDEHEAISRTRKREKDGREWGTVERKSDRGNGREGGKRKRVPEERYFRIIKKEVFFHLFFSSPLWKKKCLNSIIKMAEKSPFFFLCTSFTFFFSNESLARGK